MGFNPKSKAKSKSKFPSKRGRDKQRKSKPSRPKTVSKPTHNQVYLSTPTPPDYIFLRKGDAYLTSGCKKQSDTVGKPYYTVVDGRKTTLGIRIHHSVLSQVRREHEGTAAQRAQNVVKNDNRLAAKFESAVLASFPNVPRQNLPQIVAQAMEKGHGRVGRTGTLPIERKVTLAVRAHARHVMTDYEHLLRHKRLPRDEARKQVEEKIRATMREWGYQQQRPQQRTQAAGKPAKANNNNNNSNGRDARHANRQSKPLGELRNDKHVRSETRLTKNNQGKNKSKKKYRSDGAAKGNSKENPIVIGRSNVRVTTRSAAAAAARGGSEQWVTSPRGSPAFDMDDYDDDDDDGDSFIEEDNDEVGWPASDNSYESHEDDEDDGSDEDYSDDYGMGDEDEDDFDLA